MKKDNYLYATQGGIEYRLKEGSNKREIKYKHPDYGPPYWTNNLSNQTIGQNMSNIVMQSYI